MLGRTGLPGSGAFRSADGSRQFRMATSDLIGSHGTIGPRVHVQAFDRFGVEVENLQFSSILYNARLNLKLEANVKHVTGPTRHYLGTVSEFGEPIILDEIAAPVRVMIKDDEHGFFLFHLNVSGDCIADQWYPDLDEAKRSAELQFGITERDWILS